MMNIIGAESLQRPGSTISKSIVIFLIGKPAMRSRHRDRLGIGAFSFARLRQAPDLSDILEPVGGILVLFKAQSFQFGWPLLLVYGWSLHTASKHRQYLGGGCKKRTNGNGLFRHL